MCIGVTNGRRQPRLAGGECSLDLTYMETIIKCTCHLHSAFQCDFMCLFLSPIESTYEIALLCVHDVASDSIPVAATPIPPNLSTLLNVTSELPNTVTWTATNSQAEMPYKVIFKSQQGNLSSQSSKKQTFTCLPQFLLCPICSHLCVI